MTRSNARLAAGAGVVSIFLLLGGPSAAIALADPDNSHSDRGNGSNTDSGHGRGNSQSSDDDNNGNSNNNGKVGNGNSGSVNGGTGVNVSGAVTSGSAHADPSASRNDDVTPKVRIGSGRDNQQWLAPGGSIASDESGATGATGPGDVPASDHQGLRTPAFESPRVTFGNGRNPGAHTDDSGPQYEAPAPQPQPAPAPPPPPPPPPPAPVAPPSWVDRIATPPIPTKQLGVAPAADLSDPLWGIAGLLLIPAAGAALGFRQARAAQAVERLRRS